MSQSAAPDGWSRFSLFMLVVQGRALVLRCWKWDDRKSKTNKQAKTHKTKQKNTVLFSVHTNVPRQKHAFLTFAFSRPLLSQLPVKNQAGDGRPMQSHLNTESSVLQYQAGKWGLHNGYNRNVLATNEIDSKHKPLPLQTPRYSYKMKT